MLGTSIGFAGKNLLRCNHKRAHTTADIREILFLLFQMRLQVSAFGTDSPDIDNFCSIVHMVQYHVIAGDILPDPTLAPQLHIVRLKNVVNCSWIEALRIRYYRSANSGSQN